MRLNRWIGAGLCMTALVLQAGCTAESAENPAARVRRRSNNSVTLPEGTQLSVRTTSALSTKSSEAGQAFTANLDQPLLKGGREVAARGSQVEGKIVEADKGGRVNGLASLTVRLTSLQVGGQMVGISTDTVTYFARATKKNDAAKIGVGAGIGAAIGAIAGGGKGAAIGAAAGGGAGTGVVLATRGQAAEIPSETLLNFQLQAPLTVTSAK